MNIPFIVYARIVPDRNCNKRRTYTRSIEKIAEYVANDIAEYVEGNPTSININENVSVLATPQFAQFPARLTITGWDLQDGLGNFQPASQVEVDAPYTDAECDGYDGEPGKVVQGYMATQYLHPQGQTLDSQILTLVADLKASLEAASPYLNEIMRIDYMGITFGETGHSFP
jgi:hypothetical protein